MNTFALPKPYAAILRDKRRAFPAWSQTGEWLAVFQGIHHGLMGLWILSGSHSFQRVGGAIKEAWLAQSIGVLLFIMGVVFVMAALRSVLTLELGILMMGSSFGLGAIDWAHYGKDVLAPFYAWEGAEEIIVAILCLVLLKTFTHRRHSNFI